MKIDLKQANDRQTAFLRKAYERKRLSHAYLFEDALPQEALATACWLFCLINCTGAQKPDGTCWQCQRILNGEHPDFFRLKALNQATISIDQVRSLKSELAKTPKEGQWRFFVIEEAEKLTQEAANALLNLLEEPVAPVVTILVTRNAAQIIPTVRSRTQILYFDRFSEQRSEKKEIFFDDMTAAETASLENRSDLDQAIQYFCQELLAHQTMALIQAHQIAAQAKNAVAVKYVLFSLQQWSQKTFEKGTDLTQGAHLLELMLRVNAMSASHVSLNNCLDYLVLNF